MTLFTVPNVMQLCVDIFVHKYKSLIAKRYYNSHKYDLLSSVTLNNAKNKAINLGRLDDFMFLIDCVEQEVGRHNIKYGHLAWIFNNLLSDKSKLSKNIKVPHYSNSPCSKLLC
jgi:hypothetical protein